MTTIWDEITSEELDMVNLCNQHKKEARLKKGRVVLASNYFENEIYPQLVPALKTTLHIAARKCAIKHQKCIFNGIDCLAEILYNQNPKYPERVKDWTSAYFLFFNPQTDYRPYYPLSWILTREQAALIIQKWLRGYNVRKMKDVQEMKEFWKAVRETRWVVRCRKFPSERCKNGTPRDSRWY